LGGLIKFSFELILGKVMDDDDDDDDLEDLFVT
jgi:hypothetical protein